MGLTYFMLNQSKKILNIAFSSLGNSLQKIFCYLGISSSSCDASTSILLLPFRKYGFLSGGDLYKKEISPLAAHIVATTSKQGTLVRLHSVSEPIKSYATTSEQGTLIIFGNLSASSWGRVCGTSSSVTAAIHQDVLRPPKSHRATLKTNWDGNEAASMEIEGVALRWSSFVTLLPVDATKGVVGFTSSKSGVLLPPFRVTTATVRYHLQARFAWWAFLLVGELRETTATTVRWWLLSQDF
ncbi:unnamed protein product [Lactuca saligna]|uniref:Uncharacterized protein n=1 Tax=Lactuca saligna TaxID=75948 RepID=A0AA35ZR31_LACSI|nr:unnamed protein product [Lactuca saligna]